MWDVEDTAKFLSVYHAHKCLWNPFSPDYHDCSAKNEAFKSVVKEMDIPTLTVPDCLEHVKTIREKYRKQQLETVEELSLGKAYKSQSPWYDLMTEMLTEVINDEENVATNIAAVVPHKKTTNRTTNNSNTYRKADHWSNDKNNSQYKETDGKIIKPKKSMEYKYIPCSNISVISLSAKLLRSGKSKEKELTKECKFSKCHSHLEYNQRSNTLVGSQSKGVEKIRKRKDTKMKKWSRRGTGSVAKCKPYLSTSFPLRTDKIKRNESTLNTEKALKYKRRASNSWIKVVPCCNKSTIAGGSQNKAPILQTNVSICNNKKLHEDDDGWQMNNCYWKTTDNMKDVTSKSNPHGMNNYLHKENRDLWPNIAQSQYMRENNDPNNCRSLQQNSLIVSGKSNQNEETVLMKIVSYPGYVSNIERDNCCIDCCKNLRKNVLNDMNEQSNRLKYKEKWQTDYVQYQGYGKNYNSRFRKNYNTSNRNENNNLNIAVKSTIKFAPVTAPVETDQQQTEKTDGDNDSNQNLRETVPYHRNEGCTHLESEENWAPIYVPCPSFNKNEDQSENNRVSQKILTSIRNKHENLNSTDTLVSNTELVDFDQQLDDGETSKEGNSHQNLRPIVTHDMNGEINVFKSNENWQSDYVPCPNFNERYDPSQNNRDSRRNITLNQSGYNNPETCVKPNPRFAPVTEPIDSNHKRLKQSYKNRSISQNSWKTVPCHGIKESNHAKFNGYRQATHVLCPSFAEQYYPNQNNRDSQRNITSNRSGYNSPDICVKPTTRFIPVTQPVDFNQKRPEQFHNNRNWSQNSRKTVANNTNKKCTNSRSILNRETTHVLCPISRDNDNPSEYKKNLRMNITTNGNEYKNPDTCVKPSTRFVPITGPVDLNQQQPKQWVKNRSSSQNSRTTVPCNINEESYHSECEDTWELDYVPCPSFKENYNSSENQRNSTTNVTSNESEFNNRNVCVKSSSKFASGTEPVSSHQQFTNMRTYNKNEERNLMKSNGNGQTTHVPCSSLDKNYNSSLNNRDSPKNISSNRIEFNNIDTCVKSNIIFATDTEPVNLDHRLACIQTDKNTVDSEENTHLLPDSSRYGNDVLEASSTFEVIIPQSNIAEQEEIKLGNCCVRNTNSRKMQMKDNQCESVHEIKSCGSNTQKAFQNSRTMTRPMPLDTNARWQTQEQTLPTSLLNICRRETRFTETEVKNRRSNQTETDSTECVTEETQYTMCIRSKDEEGNEKYQVLNDFLLITPEGKCIPLIGKESLCTDDLKKAWPPCAQNRESANTGRRADEIQQNIPTVSTCVNKAVYHNQSSSAIIDHRKISKINRNAGESAETTPARQYLMTSPHGHAQINPIICGICPTVGSDEDMSFEHSNSPTGKNSEMIVNDPDPEARQSITERCKAVNATENICISHSIIENEKPQSYTLELTPNTKGAAKLQGNPTVCNNLCGKKLKIVITMNTEEETQDVSDFLDETLTNNSTQDNTLDNRIIDQGSTGSERWTSNTLLIDSSHLKMRSIYLPQESPERRNDFRPSAILQDNSSVQRAEFGTDTSAVQRTSSLNSSTATNGMNTRISINDASN